MLTKFKAHWPVVILVLISVILCFTNYTPGTFLSGWDTLHPEFNFELNLQRTLFGVFRVEQGLGAVAAHAHMVEISRIVLLYIANFILPLDFLRYFYIFLCLVLGPLGMYFLLNKHFLKNKNASFLGALFYLLNLGTLQTFNVPFEMFTTLFATLPFLFYFATSYIMESKNRTGNLLAFAISALFTTPSAYASTLWFVLFVCFFTYFFLLSAINFKKDKHHLKHFFILIFVFLLINLFWLVPNIYFILNHGKEVAQSNINKLFSEQAFLKNKEFGNITDILFLKSFYFDWNIYQDNNNFTDLLAPFINHLKDIKVIFIGYLLGISLVFGAIYSFIGLKKKFIPLFAILLISLFFLINDNFPFSFIFNFLQDHMPFFKESMRFPGNKILNIFVFLVSIFFGYFALFVIQRVKKLHLKLEAVFIIFVSLMIAYYTLPAFSGNFINPYMRVQIPDSYFKLFDYLKTQPETLRVANLPIQSQWGWAYYNWGFQGAGFLYFGIKQPLLDRDFDRWNPSNESYYREMSYAIYKEDKELLINVINKYKIGFIVIDKNVIDPQNSNNILYFKEGKDLIAKTGLISEYREYGNLEIFKLRTNPDIINVLNTNINVYPKTTSAYNDYAFSLYGNYITSDNIDSKFTNVYFPFRDLIDNQSRLNKGILNVDSEKITISPTNSVENFNSPTLAENLSLIPADLLAEKSANNLTISIYPNTPIFDQIPSNRPIKANVVVSDTNKNLFLSINENELFTLDALSEGTPLSIGKILLKNSENVVSVFNQSNSTPINDLSKKINPFFSSCDKEQKPPSVKFLGNSIILTAKGNTCILIPYKFFSDQIGNQKTNILSNLQLEFTGDANINSCIFDLETSKCLYYRSPIRQNKLVSIPYVLPLDTADKKAIRISLESVNDKTNTFILSNLSAEYIKSIADINLSKETISGIFSTITPTSFDKIYLSKNTIYDLGSAITKIKKLQNNCNPKDTNTKKEIINLENKEVIKYTSKIGSFCDHFSYPNLPHSQGYLVVIDSKNLQGLPLSLCIVNYTSLKCDIYSDLTNSKTFKKDVILLPPMEDGGIGYDINFENLGIKGSPSVNFLSSIEFIPLPYEFIQKIESKIPKPNEFNGKVLEVTRYNPLFYVVKTDNKPSLIALNLSHEKGFMAYYIDCTNSLTCLIKGFLSPLVGKEVKEHVLVDNWANGWIINETMNNKQETAKVAIIFLPQYFEYLGFAILILTFGVLSIRFIKKHHG